MSVPDLDLDLVTRSGTGWLLSSPPGAPDVWLRAVVLDADRDVVLLEAGDGSAPPAPGTRLLGAHGAGDGIRRFDVVVRRHVSGTRARFTVSRPSAFRKVDRRADARVPVRITAQLVVGGGGEMETISATTVDLSASGAAVLSPQPLRAGRRLLVLLHLDDDEPILAGAVVAGQQGTVRDEARLGLELQVLDPADRSRLDRHLAALRT